MSIHAAAALVFATMMTFSALAWAAPRIAYQIKENARDAWTALRTRHPSRAARIAKVTEWVAALATAVAVSYLVAWALLDITWLWGTL